MNLNKMVLAGAMVMAISFPLAGIAAEKKGGVPEGPVVDMTATQAKSPYSMSKSDKWAKMEERQAATETHRANVEATLANIEALLKELVELEKKRK